ncbi:MAG: hypothetical protein U0R49_06480 [Fimbriimonadales bacterium]
MMNARLIGISIEFSGGLLASAADFARHKKAENEREKEHEFHEDQTEKHSALDLFARFGLSSDSVQAAVYSDTLTDSNAEAGEADGESYS